MLGFQLCMPYDILLGAGSNFQLILPERNDCICPGENLVFECNVTGNGSTVFEGSFFECSNEVILLHSRYVNGTTAMCNNQLLALSNGVVNNTYISRLQLRLSDYTNIGKTVTCIHDNGKEASVIGNYKIPNSTAIGKVVIVSNPLTILI